MKSPDPRRDRLAGAALAGRDELRQVANDLTVALAAGDVPISLVVKARDAAQKHADSLRLALKHPEGTEPRAQRLNRNLPFWQSMKGDV